MATPQFTGLELLIQDIVDLTAASSACPWLPPLSGHFWEARLQFGLLSMRKMILGASALPPEVPRKISMSSARTLVDSAKALRITVSAGIVNLQRWVILIFQIRDKGRPTARAPPRLDRQRTAHS